MVQFFDPTQEVEIKRRRRMAEALQRRGAPKQTEVIGGYAVPQSGLEHLMRGLSGGIGAYQEATADAKEQDLVRQRQELMAKAIEKMGTSPKDAAGLLMQDPSMMKEGLSLYSDTIANENKLASELAKMKYETEQKDKEFSREADLKRELIKMRQGATEPYIDDVTGDIVQPLPKLSATEQKAFEAQQDKIMAAEGAKDAFLAIKEYQGKPMFSGFGAETLASMNRIPLIGNLIDDEKASNTTAYQNLIKTGQYKQLATTFPGAISNSEREALEKLGALASYTTQEQAKIVADSERAVSKLLVKAQERAADIATGRQYRKAASGANEQQGNPNEGRTIINKKTGQRMIMRGGQWQPV